MANPVPGHFVLKRGSIALDFFPWWENECETGNYSDRTEVFSAKFQQIVRFKQLRPQITRFNSNPNPMNPKITHYLAGILLVVLLISCKKEGYDVLKAHADKVETLPPVQSGVSMAVTPNCGGYLKSLPAYYDSSNREYPLIIFIHGIGELGNGTTNLINMDRAGLPRLIKKNAFPADFEVEGKHYSFVVISPQFKKWPTSADVKAVLDHSVKQYRIDKSRIYITGLSMGGGVTWNYAAEMGNTVAAAAPVCGGSWPDEKRTSSIAAFNLPVWAFHNADDPIVAVSISRNFITNINAHHPAVEAKVTVWATGGHDAWTKAYDPNFRENKKNLYEWMLQYSLKQ